MDCSFCQRKDELRLLSHLQKQSTGGTNRVCRVFRGKFLGIIQFTCHRGFRQQKVVRWCFPRNTRNTRKRSASRLSPADRKVRMSVLSMPVKPPAAQRTAECPGRDGQKIIFRAVDGGAPARAKHGGFTGPIKFLSCLSCVSGNGFRQVNCIIPFVKAAISN